MIDDPNLDTWLAKLLLSRGRFGQATLEAELAAARGDPGTTLARRLVHGGKLSEAEVGEALEALEALAADEDG